MKPLFAGLLLGMIVLAIISPALAGTAGNTENSGAEGTGNFVSGKPAEGNGNFVRGKPAEGTGNPVAGKPKDRDLPPVK